MTITKLAHYAIRTADLEASRRFYCDILGFREGFRPTFKFPGHWLYIGDDEKDFGVVHLIGIDRDAPEGLVEYLGDKDEESLSGSGAVDHIAFLASDLKTMRVRFDREGIAYRERTVPNLGLHQVFLDDPSGMTVELNFPADEAR